MLLSSLPVCPRMAGTYGNEVEHGIVLDKCSGFERSWNPPRRMSFMYTNVAYQGYAAPGRTQTLFGQTMGLVALTAAFFALGAYAGRNLSEGAVIVAWIAAFVVLLIMNFV